MLDAHPHGMPAATPLAGNAPGLAERLGSVAVLHEALSVSAAARLERVRDLAGLRRFLDDYHRQVLLPVELPAVRQAFEHASRGETRELLALDQQICGRLPFQGLAEASRRVGRSHLRALRPLRDERLVRRYLEAVERGSAFAWHTLVYGVMLAVYGLPLRPGLMSYAWHTTDGFVRSAARSLRLNAADGQRVLNEATAGLPAAIDRLLAPEAQVKVLAR